MTPARARLALFFVVLFLIALAGYAQQAQPGVGSSHAQGDQTVGQPASSTPPVSSAPSSKQGEDAAISQPDHRPQVHSDTISITAGYGHSMGPAVLPLYGFYGPWAYPYGDYWGVYGAFWWNPFWYPYAPYGGFGPGNDKGLVKLQVQPKTAEVLIDGAYAGTVASLKNSLWLGPGAYNLCVKEAGHSESCRRIYVLSGKRLDVVARLTAAPAEANP